MKVLKLAIYNKESKILSTYSSKNIYGQIVIYLIQIEPEIFPKSEISKKYRKCVLSKQTTIYYKFNAKRVEIIAFSDNRQDPNKIKKDIK